MNRLEKSPAHRVKAHTTDGRARMSHDRGALNRNEIPEQQKGMHRWPSNWIFRQAHGGLPVYIPRLLTASNTECPSDHHRLQDPTPQPHSTPAHSTCK